MLNKIKTLALAIMVSLFGLSSPALADSPIYTKTFSNIAVQGYDTVSYFQGDGVPVKGSEEFQTEWRGAKWQFSSQANLDAFKADPEKYAPQYGGYCAWAASQGKLAKGDALVYTKVGDKLYLNYDRSIHAKWEPNKEAFIEQADKNYPQLVDFE